MKAKILTITAVFLTHGASYNLILVNSLFTEAGNWYLDFDGQTPADYCPEFAIY